MPSLSIPKKTRSFGSNTDKYENGFQKKVPSYIIIVYVYFNTPMEHFIGGVQVK